MFQELSFDDFIVGFESNYENNLQTQSIDQKIKGNLKHSCQILKILYARRISISKYKCIKLLYNKIEYNIPQSTYSHNTHARIHTWTQTHTFATAKLKNYFSDVEKDIYILWNKRACVCGSRQIVVYCIQFCYTTISCIYIWIQKFAQHIKF